MSQKQELLIMYFFIMHMMISPQNFTSYLTLLLPFRLKEFLNLTVFDDPSGQMAKYINNAVQNLEMIFKCTDRCFTVIISHYLCQYGGGE